MQNICSTFHANLGAGQRILGAAQLQQQDAVPLQFRVNLQTGADALAVKHIQGVGQQLKVHDQSGCGWICRHGERRACPSAVSRY